MDRQEFLEYLDDYNQGDPALLADYFTDDFVFENYGHRHQGAEALAFLGSLMDLLHTRLFPETVVIEGNRIAMLGHMEITARIDHVNPAIGEMREGDRQRARLFAFYETVGARISHVWIAGWPGEAV